MEGFYRRKVAQETYQQKQQTVPGHFPLGKKQRYHEDHLIFLWRMERAHGADSGMRAENSLTEGG